MTVQKREQAEISTYHNAIIEMAWCDDTSFESIQLQTGISEKDVIKIMRSYMKPSSFRAWRKRVAGRKSKHEKLHDRV